MKKILLLGSTGSIGVNTLNVVREFPDEFEVEAITANSNVGLLLDQINEFNPKFAVIRDKSKKAELQELVGAKCKILSGDEGLIEVTKYCEYDILLSALVGFAGLAPTIEGIKRGKRIALANKETLVVAGELVIDLCKKHNAELLPVDSEHSAIFQALIGESQKEIRRIILTASGGPFLNTSKDEFDSVTVEQALDHPNWSMGSKITIDSASMMNKGLEVIEAHWLFNLGRDKIDVVIHPQSIIHSMVEFCDSSIKAQLSVPDMKLPIQYALSYPNRFTSNFIQTDFVKIGSLTFFEPDLNKFKCLQLAFDAMQEGGTAPCILNAANEIAVDKFLKGEIKFSYIPKMISHAIESINNHKSPDLETIFECDRQTRDFATKFKFGEEV
ncbi:MAG: 1-deoxy-D-xylulose-5-phosphate reductoisomerase [Melioribacteraceae bacterium]|nr:1-deoxy-D-xylulose-5-phosphate reductoisomerase [Melioribacteraceae bacterium]MCF8263580.1 1-deoxy-D-xylulose-5-phosphate reductoisomerase [Melioribacteraceae bacterium]MCF8412427.1 1-deoxy-D-xylulose-5-phosphate reductoisomerase [Melioribacteraceae bacterium]MCF8430820.1 1-deoxy-D-xylulose-5-phosphate reductoisomerase [Melioribacteraceae bacterium]